MNRLKELRERKELFQSDIAKFLGITTPAYSYYESDKREMSATTAKKLANFFNVSVDYLLGEDKKDKRLLPVLGTVKAGYNYLAEENIIEYIDPHINLSDPENYFALLVTGDSMAPFFSEGDCVVVRKQDGDFESNKVCVVLINGNEATIKKVIKTDNGIELHSFNPYYPPKKYTFKEMEDLQIKIIGIVKWKKID